MFQARLVFALLLLLGVSSQNDEDEGRPYEFSFTIDGEQHRYEKKDINGIIQGEFGFITGDGIYHVTVYATDENGSFKIVSMKNTRISEPLDRGGKPTTAGLIRQQTSSQQPTGGVPSKSIPPAAKPAAVGQPAPVVAQPPPPVVIPAPVVGKPPTAVGKPSPPIAKPLQPVAATSRPTYDFTTASTVRNGCSGCGIVTKAPPGPLNFQNPAFKNPRKEETKPLSSPVQPPSYPNQPAPPPKTPVNGIPAGLISKPYSPSGQSSNYPNIPSGPSISLPSGPINSGTISGPPSPPQTLLLAPGTNPAPTGSDTPTEQNPFGPSPIVQPGSIGINVPSAQKPLGLGPSVPLNQPSSGPIQSGLINQNKKPLVPRPPVVSVPVSQPPPGPIQSGLLNTDQKPLVPSPPVVSVPVSQPPPGAIQSGLLNPGRKPLVARPPVASVPVSQPPPRPPVISVPVSQPPPGPIQSGLLNSDQKPLVPRPPVVSVPVSQPPPGAIQSGLLNPGQKPLVPRPPVASVPVSQPPPLPPVISVPVSQPPPGPIQSRLLNSDQKPLAPRPPVVSVPVNQPRLGQIQSGIQNPNQNQIPGTAPSAISQVSVSDGVISIPGNEPIPIKDKYPNMVDGLPEGITEKDITDLLYKFNYTVGFHGHYEKGLKNGAKIGGYFVNGRDGFSRVVTYVADENGYRPKFKLINLGLDSEDTPKPDSEKKFGLKNFEFVWYPLK